MVMRGHLIISIEKKVVTNDILVKNKKVIKLLELWQLWLKKKKIANTIELFSQL